MVFSCMALEVKGSKLVRVCRAARLGLTMLHCHAHWLGFLYTYTVHPCTAQAIQAFRMHDMLLTGKAYKAVMSADDH